MAFLSPPASVDDMVVARFVAYQWISKRSVVFIADFSSILILFGFFFSPPGILRQDIAIINRVIGISVLCLIAYLLVKQKRLDEERKNRIIELNQALAEVKTLSGMLPICAWPSVSI